MKPNPEYQNAPYELVLLNEDGDTIPAVVNPHRFRCIEDYKSFLKTFDLKYSIPPYIP